LSADNVVEEINDCLFCFRDQSAPMNCAQTSQYDWFHVNVRVLWCIFRWGYLSWSGHVLSAVIRVVNMPFSTLFYCDCVRWI